MSLEEFHIEPIGCGMKLSVWDYPWGEKGEDK
jgi:hypothetical protein